jgi:hypothetical protein
VTVGWTSKTDGVEVRITESMLGMPLRSTVSYSVLCSDGHTSAVT